MILSIENSRIIRISLLSEKVNIFAKSACYLVISGLFCPESFIFRV